MKILITESQYNRIIFKKFNLISESNPIVGFLEKYILKGLENGIERNLFKKFVNPELHGVLTTTEKDELKKFLKSSQGLAFLSDLKKSIATEPNIGNQMAMTNWVEKSLEPFIKETSELKIIPFNELDKTLYHGGPQPIRSVNDIKTSRERMVRGIDFHSATANNSHGFYVSQNSWMKVPGAPNPFRETEGLYKPNTFQSAEYNAIGKGEGFISAGELNPNVRIVDWDDFRKLPQVKNLGYEPNFLNINNDIIKIANNLNIDGFKYRDDEYNIINPKNTFKFFKPYYKKTGNKGWEKYN
jgi:hypothetical protein